MVKNFLLQNQRDNVPGTKYVAFGDMGAMKFEKKKFDNLGLTLTSLLDLLLWTGQFFFFFFF